MKHKLLILYCWFIRTVLYFFPDIPIIMKFRGWLYSFVLKQCGRNFQVVHNVIINTPQCFVIGDNVRVGLFVRLNGGQYSECYIKDDVIIGQGTMISASNHEFNGKNYRDKKVTTKYITIINQGSWIGANCSITANSIVPAYSISGANSCVTRRMENIEGALYGGVPAKFIKKIIIPEND